MTARIRVSTLIGQLVLGAAGLHVAQGHTVSLVAATPSIDISRSTALAPKRDITLDDMVSLREVSEPRQSPDGQRVAFLVKQPFRSCDCYRTALYVAEPHGDGSARKLAEEDHIANVQWLPDGKFVSYLSRTGGSVQLWRSTPVTGRADRLFVHTTNRDRSTAHVLYQSRDLPVPDLLDYRWSPDGSRIAFTAATPVDPSIVAQAVKEGYRYDDTTMSALDLAAGDWAAAHSPKQLWLYDVGQKREHLLWTSAADGHTNITALQWSPSGGKLAFTYSTNSGWSSDSVGIVDATTFYISEAGLLGGTMDSAASAAWSRDGHAIAYFLRSMSGSYAIRIFNSAEHSTKELASKLYPGHAAWLIWDADRHRLLFRAEGIERDHRPTGIYTVPDGGGQPVRLTPSDEKVSDCDAPVQDTIACVWQSTSVSPRAALVSVADGSIRKLASVNPELDSVEFGPVRELHWNNAYGDETNGYLLTPRRRTPGERLPLVVMGYGFSGEFVAQANDVLTTYPAQAFARDGIVVLLFNYPRFDDWDGANFERGSRAYGYGPLSSIQAIIERLGKEGLVDTHRVGIMGHSLGGFFAQLGITQTNLFKAAELHNGGTSSEPGTYWEYGMQQGREIQEHVMGGPPYGETLKNYLGYSMALNADRIQAPVLMEYDALASLSAMEYYEAMRHYGVPVDFYVYPNDGHVTHRPEHRYMSLQRNLDWFEFWLLGKENDAESKKDQYLRWRELKVLAERNAAARGAS